MPMRWRNSPGSWDNDKLGPGSRTSAERWCVLTPRRCIGICPRMSAPYARLVAPGNRQRRCAGCEIHGQGALWHFPFHK